MTGHFKLALDDGVKCHTIVGITLNNILVPPLRDFIEAKLKKHYQSLVTGYSIDTSQNRLTIDGNFKFNYDSKHPGFNSNNRAHPITDHHELAKMYLQHFMRHFNQITDNKFDASAVLTVLEKASCFNGNVQNLAKHLKFVRNSWAHCNYSEWTTAKCQDAIETMKNLCNAIDCASQSELSELLSEWETKGQALLGDPALVRAILDDHKSMMTSIAHSKPDYEYVDEQYEKYWFAMQELERNLGLQHADLQQQVEQNTRDIRANRQAIQQQSEKISVIQADVSEIKQNRQEQANLDDNYTVPNTVPHQNPYFSGREDFMTIVHEVLKSGKHVVISGIGGLGKTTAASKLAERLEEDFPGGIFWITCDSDSMDNHLTASLSRLWSSLPQSTQKGKDDAQTRTSVETNAKLHDIVSFFCQRSNKEGKILLIVDNVDATNPSNLCRELLAGPWIKTCKLSMVITSRHPKDDIERIFPGLKPDTVIKQLECFMPTESIKFLCTRTERDDFKEEDLKAIVEELSGLPLALEQAAAYIKRVKYDRSTLANYVAKLKENRIKVLNKSKASTVLTQVEEAHLSVQTTWSMNLEAMKAECPGVERVMQVLSLLDPEGIPAMIINMGEPEFHDASDIDIDDIKISLTKWSLFTGMKDNQEFKVHRLVQSVIQESFIHDTDKKRSVCSNAIRMLLKALHSTDLPLVFYGDEWGFLGLDPSQPCCSGENLKRLHEELTFSLSEWSDICRNIRAFLTYVDSSFDLGKDFQELREHATGSYNTLTVQMLSQWPILKPPITAEWVYLINRPRRGSNLFAEILLRKFPDCPLGYMLVASDLAICPKTFTGGHVKRKLCGNNLSHMQEYLGRQCPSYDPTSDPPQSRDGQIVEEEMDAFTKVSLWRARTDQSRKNLAQYFIDDCQYRAWSLSFSGSHEWVREYLQDNIGNRKDNIEIKHVHDNHDLIKALETPPGTPSKKPTLKLLIFPPEEKFWLRSDIVQKASNNYYKIDMMASSCYHLEVEIHGQPVEIPESWSLYDVTLNLVGEEATN